MRRNRMSVADLRALKGKRQLTMLCVDTLEEAAAASVAGIDILSIVDPVWTPAMREAAGDCFVQVGLLYGQLCTYEDYLRAGHAAMNKGGDACYCAASLDTIARLSAEGVPIIGHVGLIPSKATWTGGFKASARRRRARSRPSPRSNGSRPPAQSERNSKSSPSASPRKSRSEPRSSCSRWRRSGRRRPISLRRGQARLHARPSAAPRQGLPQFPRRIRSPATGADRRLHGIPRRRRQRRDPEKRHTAPIDEPEFAEFLTALPSRALALRAPCRHQSNPARSCRTGRSA